MFSIKMWILKNNRNYETTIFHRLKFKERIYAANSPFLPRGQCNRWLTVCCVSWNLLGWFRCFLVGVDVFKLLLGPGRSSVHTAWQPATGLKSVFHLYTFHWSKFLLYTKFIHPLILFTVSLSSKFLRPSTFLHSFWYFPQIQFSPLSQFFPLNKFFFHRSSFLSKFYFFIQVSACILILSTDPSCSSLVTVVGLSSNWMSSVLSSSFDGWRAPSRAGRRTGTAAEDTGLLSDLTEGEVSLSHIGSIHFLT